MLIPKRFDFVVLMVAASVALVSMASCDLIRTDTGLDTLSLDTDPWITFAMEAQHLGWKDEITLHHTGLLEFRRLVGDKKPNAERALFDDELLHFMNNADNLHAYSGICTGYDETAPNLYSITLHSEDSETTIHCDGSSLARLDENSDLRAPVSLLREFRMSMLGEVRFGRNLKFDMQPEKTVFNLDEPVVLHYNVSNATHQAVEMIFPSSAQFEVKIYRDGEIIYSTGLSLSLGILTSWVIPPRSTKKREYLWDHSSIDGSIYHDRKAKSGTYTIVQYLQNGNSPYRASEITITEQGEEALQPRVLYNRYDDPTAFHYELNNRISEPASFDFPTQRNVGFRLREYDLSAQIPGGIIYEDVSSYPATSQLNLGPFEEYTWTETWDLTDASGKPIPNGFYWAEMWLMDQEPDYKAGRLVFIQK